MLTYGIYESPLGKIIVAKSKKGLVLLDFADIKGKVNVNNEEFKELFKKLDLYFQGKPVSFDEALDLNGISNFRKRVYEEVRKIKWGEVKTYNDIAKSLKTSPRAVGNALAKNEILLIIPCHRVVAKNGLGGYSCGIDVKKKLLELEGIKR